MENPSIVLRKLGLSDSEIQLYLTMAARGSMTASELTKAAHAKRPTVYYALRQLVERGLAHRGGSAGVERFQAESPEKLLTLLALKHRELEEIETEVAALVPALLKTREPHEGLPAVSFYEGDAAMKQAVMETLYCRSRHIDSLAPADNFFWQIGQAFSSNYVAERVDRKITTRNLWEKPLDAATMRKSYSDMSQVRIIPAGMRGKFRTTMFLYDDKVMYISSRKSGYVLLVRSKEHHELMAAMYEQLWQVSAAVTAAGR